MKNKRESAMYGTLMIVVSTLTDTRFKDKIVNIVFEISWHTKTMVRRLEDHKRRGVAFACMTVSFCAASRQNHAR